MEFRILGPLEAEIGGEVIDLGTLRQQHLLALLLMRAGDPVSTDRLADELWTGNPPNTARHTLQVYVYRLRKALGPEGWRLESRPPGYLLKVSEGELDSLRFHDLADAARRVLGHSPKQVSALLAEALGLWRGQVMSDLPDLVALEPERAHLEAARLNALEDRVEADLALGRHRQLVGELEALVSDHPFRERFWGQLMLALYRSGRQAEALRAFQRVRETLAEELGIEPGPSLVEMEGRILFQDPILATPATTPSTSPPRSLPEPRTRFVGRRREMAGVRGLLTTRRLVTVTGAPGSGKTRLAVEAARVSAGEFPHGVFFVSLADVEEQKLLLAVISSTLGITATEQPLTDALVNYLRPRRLLLVLDNFEHLLAGAEVLGRLLDAAPGLRVLATSRAPLRLSGEQLYPLGPLPLPLPEEVAAAPSGVDVLALFADRAQAVDPYFTLDSGNGALVADIVARLDRLPLAIELAAARLRSLPLEELARRLDPALPVLTGGPIDQPLRHRSLHDTIAWSHDLLDPAQRALLRRLGVFRGSFTVEAAEAVVAGPPVEDVSESLSDLVEASLVQPPTDEVPPRFSMLETIREYALERLREAGEDEEFNRRHAEFYAQLAEHAEAELTGPNQAPWLGRLASEYPNLRGALAWARDHRAGELGLLMAGRLWRFWQLWGHLSEGRHLLEEVLEVTEDTATVPRVKALIGLAGICYWQSDLDGAEARYGQALDLLQHLDDLLLRAEALSGQMMTLACHRGDPEAALPLEGELHALATAHDHPILVLRSLVASGAARFFAGDMEGGRIRFTQALAGIRQAGNRWVEGDIMRALGLISYMQERYEEANDSLQQSLTIAQEMGHLPGVAVDLNWLGRVAVARGEAERGVTLAGAASRLRETIGGGHVIEDYASILRVGEPQDVARELLTDSEIHTAWVKGQVISLDEIIDSVSPPLVGPVS